MNLVDVFNGAQKFYHLFCFNCSLLKMNFYDQKEERKRSYFYIDCCCWWKKRERWQQSTMKWQPIIVPDHCSKSRAQILKWTLTLWVARARPSNEKFSHQFAYSARKAFKVNNNQICIRMLLLLLTLLLWRGLLLLLLFCTILYHAYQPHKP